MVKRIPLRARILAALSLNKNLLTDSGIMSDGSCSWIEIRKPKNRRIVSIKFDAKGEKIQDVEIHKEIIQVVDQKKTILMEELIKNLRTRVEILKLKHKQI